jgi:NADPH:quinone reductase
MRSIQLTKATGYSGLELTSDYEPGRPGDNQVLVEIAAAGVTPLDHTIASGEPLPLPPTLPLILGNEGAGVIAESSDPAWPEGTPVAFTGPYGMFRAGSWAEGTVVDTAHLARVPEGVPLITASAMPVAYLTAYLALRHAGFEPGKSVLATGAGGSVGNATYQLARAMGASTVITTAGSPEKAAAARATAMERVIDLSSEDLAAKARELSGGAGVDMVVDAVGGGVAASALGALKFGGAAVVIGYSAGRIAPVRLTDLIWTGASVRGFNLFFEPPARIAEAYAEVFSLAAHKAISPAIDRVAPLEDAAAALEYLIEGRPFGKVVLSVGGSPQ